VFLVNNTSCVRVCYQVTDYQLLTVSLLFTVFAALYHFKH